MSWQARLALDYSQEAGRSVARFAHEGPLRVLRSLYPEGGAVCHNVLVHPPGGLVGGDTLDIAVGARAGSHGLVTTPGAARFYRSEGEAAVQQAQIRLEAGARLEWMPLETIYYPGCIARNTLRLDLAAGAELMGWDIAAFGLPQARQPFAQGDVWQHLQLGQAWLERGRIAAGDERLMNGPLGLAENRCLGTLFLATGEALSRQRREQALTLARDAIDAQPGGLMAGVTAPCEQVVVVRVLAPLVEPALALFKAIRLAWRAGLWQMPAVQPRGWAI